MAFSILRSTRNLENTEIFYYRFCFVTNAEKIINFEFEVAVAATRRLLESASGIASHPIQTIKNFLEKSNGWLDASTKYYFYKNEDQAIMHGWWNCEIGDEFLFRYVRNSWTLHMEHQHGQATDHHAFGFILPV